MLMPKCMRLLRLWAVGILANLLLMQNASALPTISPRMQLNIQVEVIDPTCNFVNGSSPIRVDFGNNIVSSEIDGENYIKDINYTLRCSGLSKNILRFKMSGTSGFDSRYLDTNKTGLGIVFYMGGRLMPLNEWQSFYNGSSPTLQSAPIKKSGVKPSGGAFSSSATLLLDYQ